MKHYYVKLRNGDIIEEVAGSKSEAIDAVCEETGVNRSEIRSVRRVGSPDPEAVCEAA